ncbi:hypothetical protein [Tomitella gaofuii]|uniref:hypothetical protein n=1 Tax=Tomitella gaofuii TaxID=2760083 RepID=UPI0015FB279B|nr:hypothetical protein [Tomitella gaofuii]
MIGVAAMSDSAREAYLRGDIGFDAAVRKVVGIDDERVRPLLAGVLSDLADALGPLNPPLSSQERQALDDAGLPEGPGSAAAAMVRSRTLAQEVTDTALSVAAAAERIGVTDARVRQLIRERKLWAFDPGVRGGRRLPVAQFTGDGMVPYLDRIMPHVPTGLHPLALHRLLTLPRADLAQDGHPMSLIDWAAASGGDPERLGRAVEIAQAVGWEAA